MRVLRCASLAMLCWTVGCTPATTPPPPAAAPPAAAPAAPPPPAAGAPTSTAKGVPTAARVLDVEFSTAVGLAQTGPDGILVGFSLDYKFTTAPPKNARFGLLLKSSDGQSVLHEQPLKQSGNITLLVPQWRPDNGPFTGSIVELGTGGEVIAESDGVGFSGP